MIHLEDRGHVALLTIDRPERRNALDHEALDQLARGARRHRLGAGRGAHRRPRALLCRGRSVRRRGHRLHRPAPRGAGRAARRSPSCHRRRRRSGARSRHAARGGLRPAGRHRGGALRRAGGSPRAHGRPLDHPAAVAARGRRTRPCHAPRRRRPTGARRPSASGSCSASAISMLRSGGRMRSRPWPRSRWPARSWR